MTMGAWRGSSGRQPEHTCSDLRLDCPLSLRVLTIRSPKAMPKAKKDKERVKATAGQLFSSSRPGSRSQTPAPPDPDLESVQLASLTSDTSQNQVYQQAQLVFGAGSAAFMQSTQIIMPPDPTPLDPDTIPPTHLSKTNSYSQDPLLRAASTAPVQVSPEAARLPSSVSLNQTPVHIARIRCLTSC